MNKNLAIQGHVMRGNEVIEILEMLGGKNNFYYDGKFKELIYTIGSELELNVFNINSPSVKNDYIIFTLEEFIEKFPYKVGDKVIHDGEVLPIIGMKWCSSKNTVIYTMKKNNYGTIDCYDCTWMRPYKEETFGECIEKTINECLFGKKENMDKEIKIYIPEGYKYAGVVNQRVVFEKIVCKYPKTHLECCDVLGRTVPIIDDVEGYKWELIMNFQRLLVCRDAYWKIVGEQMGLGKPWEPDWKDLNFKYCLKKMGDNIEKSSEMTISCILAFPTEEIRNIFYNNFKNIIEQCKELL